MVCKKRRRYRLASIVSYMCTFIGMVFIISNVIMLRRGFVQLYSTTFGDHHSHPGQEYRNPDAYGLRSAARRRPHGRLRHRALPVLDFPRIELPAAALAAELHLRKLMEDESKNGFFRRPISRHDYESVLSKQDARYLRAQEIIAPRPPYGVSFVSVSSRDLRRFLHATSDCAGLDGTSNVSVIGSGWTKLVYRTRYRDEQVALKTIDLSGHDLVKCVNESENDDGLSQCYENAVLKLLKEMLLMRGFDSPHIVKPLAHCVPDIPFNGHRSSMVTMATELGEGLDIIKLLRMSWEDRLKISYGLCKLLYYLAHSPYGSVILSDFRRQQFILVDGDIKLTDLDDMGFSERLCRTDSNCQQYYSSVNLTIRTKCVAGQCLGMNEKTNIFNVARHFTSFLLPHGAPRPLRPVLDQLVGDFSNVTKTSKQLLQDITIIIDDYSTGAYLNRSVRDRTFYRVISGSDMPGQYDYNCQYCMDGSGCTVSVYDIKEAEQLCDADVQCKAFVLTDSRTWTGRIVAHLKNGVGRMRRNARTTLYVNPRL